MRKRKIKENKTIQKLKKLSDEEFMQYYNKYYAKSAVCILLGVVLAAIAMVLIVFSL